MVVEREQTVNILQSMMPMLSKEELLRRIETASSFADPIQRALVLFQGNDEIIERVLAIQLLQDEAIRQRSLVEELSKKGERVTPLLALRPEESLPSDVQAYLNLLMSQVDSDEFDANVELFLRGVR